MPTGIRSMPVLTCRDVKSSLAFYTEKLGFDTANTFVDDHDHWFFAIAQLGTITLGLAHDAHAKPHGNWEAYLYIDDAKTYAAQIEARGVTINTALHETFYGMLEFDVTDPEGHAIAFGQDMNLSDRGPGL